jgi:hypothetical protein
VSDALLDFVRPDRALWGEMVLGRVPFGIAAPSFASRIQSVQSDAGFAPKNLHCLWPVWFGGKKLEDRFKEFGVFIGAVVSLSLHDANEDVHHNGNEKRFRSANRRNDRYWPQPAPSRHLRIVG